MSQLKQNLIVVSVQEKDTIAKTSAINITPTIPPISAALSALLAQLVGSVNS